MTAVPWQPPRADHPPRRLHVPRQRAAVLAEVCRGHSNARIAADLNLSIETVKTHLRLLTLDAGTTSRTHLVADIYSGALLVLVPPPAAWEREAG